MGRLAQTLGAIARQTDRRWRAVVVANAGARLPDLPDGVRVSWVTLPPNRLHRRGSATVEEFREAVRTDKGMRVLTGLVDAEPTGHVMIVDDDDFVSARLTAHVASNPTATGWCLETGFAWQEGGIALYLLEKGFSRFCGTSHIVRADLLNVPPTRAAADPDYVRRTLGSHVYIEGDLADAGHALSTLPFPGAVYRIGHAGAHSQSKGIARTFIFNRSLLREPWRLANRFGKLRLLHGGVRREFFG